MPFAQAHDGARLQYWVHPSTATYPPTAQRPGLLLIAGQALGASSFDPLLSGFTAAGPVIAFDHRGVGGSDDVFMPRWSTRDIAADALAVLDAARGRDEIGDTIDVYGFSMGGRAAQWLAADHPDRVRRLILGATSVGDPHGVPRPPDVLRTLLRSDREALLQLFFTPEWLNSNPWAAEAITARPRSLQAQRAHFAASSDHDGWEAAARIVAPTLILTGADDRMCLPQNSTILCDRIVGSELVIYPGLRHGYHLQGARTTADAMRFLAAS